MNQSLPSASFLKHIRKIMVATGIATLSLSYAQAVVTLDVDENIKVTAINGKSVNTSLFQPIERNFQLQPGNHVITAKYDRLYELRGDEHDYLRSGNVTITAQLNDNQTYRLVMPGQPEQYREAKEYAKHPTLAIMQGNNILAKETGAENSSGILSGITGLFGGNDAQQQNSQAIAAINSQSANTGSSNSTYAAPVTTVPNVNSANTSTLDKFMQVWLQASPDEREKIRQWIQQ